MEIYEQYVPVWFQCQLRRHFVLQTFQHKKSSMNHCQELISNWPCDTTVLQLWRDINLWVRSTSNMYLYNFNIAPCWEQKKYQWITARDWSQTDRVIPVCYSCGVVYIYIFMSGWDILAICTCMTSMSPPVEKTLPSYSPYSKKDLIVPIKTGIVLWIRTYKKNKQKPMS